MTYHTRQGPAVPVRARRCLHHLRQLSLLADGADRSQPLSHVDRLGRQRRRRPAARSSPTPKRATTGPPIPSACERAGISWKVYQDVGVGLDAAGFWGWTDDPYIGNYGDNSLLYFHQYQYALPGTPLAERARTGTNILAHNREPDRLMDIFRDDVQRGRLPQVSWIVAPEAYCEHPNWEPDFGAWYVSQVIDILASNPDVWSKMALFITYDEEGGFFDHLVPPTPPQSRAQGLSTVETTNEIFPGDAGHASGPYGLGHPRADDRVSPWSRGGWVNSQLFDHTSLIRFLEARFGHHHPDLIETNITPWRRAVVGDLTTRVRFQDAERVATGRTCRAPTTSSLRIWCGSRTKCRRPEPSDAAEAGTRRASGARDPVHPGRARRRSRRRRFLPDSVPEYGTRERGLSGPFRQQRGCPPHLYR